MMYSESPLTAGPLAGGRTRSAIQAPLTSTLARLDLRNEDLTSLQVPRAQPWQRRQRR